jgi:hypothetical protein
MPPPRGGICGRLTLDPLVTRHLGAQAGAFFIIIIIISVLFITLSCNFPEWCEKIKLSNLLLPRKGGTIKSLQLLSTVLSSLAIWERKQVPPPPEAT